MIDLDANDLSTVSGGFVCYGAELWWDTHRFCLGYSI